MRRPWLWLLTVVVGGVAALTAVAAGDGRARVQSTGVLNIAPVADIYPGREACQAPLTTFDEVRSVRFGAIAGPRTPRLAITVRDVGSNRLLAQVRLPGAPETTTSIAGTLDREVPADRRVAVCLRNDGRGENHVILRGDNGSTDLCTIFPDSQACRWHFAHPVSSTSVVTVDGEPVPGTLDVELLRPTAASVLGQAPELFRRASTFRPGFVTPTLWWVLLALCAIGAPAALTWGVRRLPETPSPTDS